MSSAENGRLVWITEDIAITIFAALHAHRPSSRDEFITAWDAAPADPAEAVQRALGVPAPPQDDEVIDAKD